MSKISLAALLGPVVAVGLIGGAEPPSSRAAEEAVHWGYHGAGGPSPWRDLSPDYRACGAGRMQSPIDLDGGEPVDMAAVEFDYRPTTLTIGNNGHTVQVDYPPGSALIFNGRRFELRQFHFHAPSEHAIDGKRYPMEMHLVHVGADGTLAVIGVLFEAGAANPALVAAWDRLPGQAGAPESYQGVPVDARDLVAAAPGYFRYMGSLTTPPCSEGVNWFVVAEPASVSAEQIEKFTAIVGANARPLQPRNNRLLLRPARAE